MVGDVERVTGCGFVICVLYIEYGHLFGPVSTAIYSECSSIYKVNACSCWFVLMMCRGFADLFPPFKVVFL